MKQSKLRNERIKRNWTLEYVAHQLDVAKQTVHDWEVGRRYPSYIVLCKLEDLFQMPHRELLAQIGEAEDKSKLASF